MKKVYLAVMVVLAALALMAAPTLAANNGNALKGGPSSTTLDACGYFTGTQTPSVSQDSVVNGMPTHSERGTWTGVLNNYVNTQVASLGDVHGAYYEVTTTDANGNVSGTESFTSNAGKIEQTFTYGPDVAGGFSVTVTATRDLSFLTSDTNGGCYTGPFPRP